MSIDLSALQADLDSIQQTQGGHPCRVQQLVAEHPEAEETLRKAIASTQYSARNVARVLTRNGLDISEGSVNKHRKGECRYCKAQAAKVQA